MYALFCLSVKRIYMVILVQKALFLQNIYINDVVKKGVCSYIGNELKGINFIYAKLRPLLGRGQMTKARFTTKMLVL